MSFLCVGQMVADILVKPINYIDYSIDTQKVELIQVKSGGDSLNVATALAKLDQSVSFIGKCGEDYFGQFLCETAHGNGVNIEGIKRDKNLNTSSVIVSLSSTGERAFFYYGGANEKLAFDDIDLSLLDKSRFVYVGGTYSLTSFDGEGAKKMFIEAKNRGVMTAMDVTWDTTGKWLDTITPCLPYLDYFFPSLYEAKEITGKTEPEEITAFLKACGVKTVILKMGESGSYISSDKESFYHPAVKTEVVDTTGAGDCFVAGFLTGLNNGWTLQKCASFGTAIATCCISSVGATEGVPSYQDALKIIESYKISI